MENKRIAYKLFRLHKNGSIGPLFINRKQRLKVGVPVLAENHPTKGYAVRPGWHTCAEPNAPHLSKKGRVWCKVHIEDYTAHQRPATQGGLWYTANKLTVLEIL